MLTLTRRQFDVLLFVDQFIDCYGYSPSFAEIGYGCGLTSLATVHKHVTNLLRKGVLTNAYNRSRTSAITPRGKRILEKVASERGDCRLVAQAAALATVGCAC